MRISVLRKKTKEIENFNKKQWPIADKENYGPEKRWIEEKYYILSKENNNNILGILLLVVVCGLGHIETLIVSSNHRKKGIGRELIQKAEKISQKKGCHKMHLETGKSWSAFKFYRKMGYEIEAELPKHFFKQNVVIFTKYL